MIMMLMLVVVVMMRLPNLLFLAALVAAFHFLAAASCVSSSRTRPFVSADNSERWTEQKSRLGSTPPSCHNKCNMCNPCMAVQVPTLPTHQQPLKAADGVPVLIEADQYSNYKPLGWKCRCGNRLFNP
ncbi:unnamed protein product [Victoria cruziana]